MTSFDLRGLTQARAGLAVLVGLAGSFAAVGFSAAVNAADLDYPPRYGSYKDSYEPRSDWRPAHRRHVQRDCVPRAFVREELRADGWRDFRDPQPRGSVVVVEARRVRSGRPFELTIDRCSGDVIGAVPLAPARRAYLRPFRDDWRWRGDRRWHDRADWRDDYRHGPRRYRDSY